MDFGHAHRGAQRCGLDEYGVLEFPFDGALNLLWILFPVVAVNGDPWHNENFRHLQQPFGDVFVHANGRAKHARANEGESSKIEQALDGAVFSERSVHYGKNHVEALTGAAAIEWDQRRIRRISRHHYRLATAQDFRKHLLRARSDTPVAFFGDADGHGFVFVGIEATNHGSRGCQRYFVLARSAAKKHTDTESLVLIAGRVQGDVLSRADHFLLQLPRFRCWFLVYKAR